MRFENFQKKKKKNAKAITENVRKEIDYLEIELETDLRNYQTSQKYLNCKSNLDEIYSKRAEGVKIRSKCD